MYAGQKILWILKESITRESTETAKLSEFCKETVVLTQLFIMTMDGKLTFQIVGHYLCRMRRLLWVRKCYLTRSISDLGLYLSISSKKVGVWRSRFKVERHIIVCYSGFSFLGDLLIYLGLISLLKSIHLFFVVFVNDF